MHRPALRTALAVLGFALAAGAAPAAPPPIRIAFVGPLSGPLAKSAEESLLGLRTAVATGVGTRPVEVTPFDDRDDPKAATEAVLEAQKDQFAAIVAAPTSVTVAAVAARARKGRTPVLVVGTAWPEPDFDPEDPVLFVGGWAADQGLNVAAFLVLHSEKSGLGLYRDCLNPGIVEEASLRGRELGDAVERNLGERQKLVGRIQVPPHGAPTQEDLKGLKAARCDRLVLFGEPDLIDRTAEALKAAAWDVPLFCGDGMLSRAAATAFDGTVRKANYLTGVPARALAKAWRPAADPYKREFPAENLQARLDAMPGATPPVAILPRVRTGWLAGWSIVHACESLKRPSAQALLGALRELRYGDEEERGRALFDQAGRAALLHWILWTQGEKGPEPIKPDYLPYRGYGPLMRQKLPADWDKVPVDKETKIIWLTFGEAKEKGKERPKGKAKERADGSRTIEEDMAALGLGTMGYEGELDPWLLDELMVRTLGKINTLFLKNYDGTFVPGLSFNVHFTATKPDLDPSKYWKGHISGEKSWDEKKEQPTEDDPGGMFSSGTAFIYSRWMRFHMAIRDKRLRPGMNASDRKFIDGLYAWGTAWEENVRSDSIRALLDGYADGFAMTGAHEFGHGFGCGHDTESPRSIMNVVDAVGLGSCQAEWIPAHVKAIETAIGRYGVKKK